MTLTNIPSSLWPYFQEYDVRTLDLDRDANLIIQRTLEYGTWDEVRWLFRTYGGPRALGNDEAVSGTPGDGGWAETPGRLVALNSLPPGDRAGQKTQVGV